MTDLDTRPNAWHSISEGPDAELAELRRRLAAAELRATTAELAAMNAVAAEDFAQLAFETAKLRADRLEPALQKALIDLITPKLPRKSDAAEGIADTMVDDIAAGTTYDELEIAGHIESYLEGPR
jgi:hypothetical protein